jgi:hypothetical protein
VDVKTLYLNWSLPGGGDRDVNGIAIRFRGSCQAKHVSLD